MSDDVFVPIESDLLAIAYARAEHVGFAAAERSIRSGDGVLAYMGKGVSILYGISYHKGDEQFVMFANYGGTQFMDKFDTLDEVFEVYALNYKRFRYVELRDLNKAALDYHRQEMATARTNSER